MSGRRAGQSLVAHEKHWEKASYDALHHDQLALAIVNHIENMPPGSVIAVQGSWGRGKTDVVTRVYDLFSKNDRPAPIWIDPWQYGRPDLIQPVVIELLSRDVVPAGKREWLKDTARILLHASNAMAFKAVSVFVPFGSVIDPAKEPVEDLIARALGDDRPRAGTETEADPVHEMAERFRDLVEAMVPRDSGARLLVCVDDLDRCLPDQQIAMLEAIHFLTSARANCTFLIAIDPVLVQQAALAHYRTNQIDINQYLDKLFQLRISLRSLQPEQIGDLVNAELDAEVAQVLRDGLGVGPDAVRSAFSDVFYLPELTNPRLVHRAFWRLRLAAALNVKRDHAAIRAPGALVPLVAWCAIAERWPQLRQLLQATGNDLAQWNANITAVCGYYGYWIGQWAGRGDAEREEFLAEAASVIDRLPGRLQQPDLGQFLNDRVFAGHHSQPRQLAQLKELKEIDAALVSFGL